MIKETKKNKINIFSAEREIILEDDEKIYSVFEIEENGNIFAVFATHEALIFAQRKEDEIIEIEDEAIIDILFDVLEKFFEENDLVDKEGNIITHNYFNDEAFEETK
ncbi:Hypothetical protein MAU_5800 [Metamycoplasma auris 15026]|uniref:DUF1292 domain-containing protein n=1 Tax=Metamycoplasma auris 15026 TaxID=1188233 RepID=N9UZ81_9BACT|nr:hypothetical protein [Metamycoplasma auris]ENY68502.1 Hypothetical protein MAU_5800 [Metamycoplasma auris 15026]